MTRAALNILTVIILLLSRCCDANRKLLVFLIDGFRYDYMDDLQNLAGFREIVENGVKVDYLTPDFPSLSYPNYYSLMTGEFLTTHDFLISFSINVGYLICNLSYFQVYLLWSHLVTVSLLYHVLIY